MAEKPLSRPLPITILGIGRLGVGVSSWIFPRQIWKAFALMTLPPSSTIIMRLFGVRDAVLAVLLLTANNDSEQQRMLAAGAISDIFDILACAVGFISGEVDQSSALMLAGGASVPVLLAAWAWRSLPGKVKRV